MSLWGYVSCRGFSKSNEGGSVMTIESLERRLHSLEQRNARLQIVVLPVVLLAVGAIFTSVSETLWAGPSSVAVQDTVRAKRIEVIDTDGTLLTVLGKLSDGQYSSTAGLALVSHDKHVVQLALTKSKSDGSVSSADLEVYNPEDENRLFSAGVGYGSEGVGFHPQIQLVQREGKYMMWVDSYGLNVFVKSREKSSAAAISLLAKEDHSAELMLGGLFKPFKVRAIAEADNPRIEVQKGPENNSALKTFGFAP